MSKLGDLGLYAANRLVGTPPSYQRPAGRMVELPGRGSTYVTDLDDEPGSNRPVLMLMHALATTGQLCWYPVMQNLRRHYRVVTYDQRSHGRGIRPDVFRLEDCADDAVAVADALGIDQFVGVGYSMGSLIAPLTWKRHPDRVAGLVLAAAANTFQDTRRERVAFSLVSAAVSSRARTSTVTPMTTQPPTENPADHTSHERWAYSQFRANKAAAVGAAVTAIMQYDATGWAHTINVPTSFVVTTLDRVVPPHRQRWLAGRVQHSTMYDVNAGHGACVLQADLFRPALTVACASVASRLPVK